MVAWVKNMMKRKNSKYGIAVMLVAFMGLVTACGKMDIRENVIEEIETEIETEIEADAEEKTEENIIELTEKDMGKQNRIRH